jgi:prophage regulatory protein
MPTHPVAPPTKILRRPAVVDRVGLSSTTIWRLERAGQFPRSIRLGPNSVGWREHDLEAWIAERARLGRSSVRSRRPKGLVSVA